MVAGDGVGMGGDDVWPKPGKLGAMIAQSLRQNATARLELISAPGEGVRVTIFFDRADAAAGQGLDPSSPTRVRTQSCL